MLLVLAGIIALFWLIAQFAQWGGGFVNFLLALVIVLVVAHIMGRRTHTI